MAFSVCKPETFWLLNCEAEISKHFTMRSQRRLAYERKSISVCVRRIQDVQTLRRSNSDVICKPKLRTSRQSWHFPDFADRDNFMKSHQDCYTHVTPKYEEVTAGLLNWNSTKSHGFWRTIRHPIFYNVIFFHRPSIFLLNVLYLNRLTRLYHIGA